MNESLVKLPSNEALVLLEIAGAEIISADFMNCIKLRYNGTEYHLNFRGGGHYTVYNVSTKQTYCSIGAGHQHDGVSCGFFALAYIFGWSPDLSEIKQKLRGLLSTVQFDHLHCDGDTCELDDGWISNFRMCPMCMEYPWTRLN